MYKSSSLNTNRKTKDHFLFLYGAIQLKKTNSRLQLVQLVLIKNERKSWWKLARGPNTWLYQ